MAFKEDVERAKALLDMSPQQRLADGLPHTLKQISQSTHLGIKDLELIQAGIEPEPREQKKTNKNYDTIEFLMSHIKEIDAALVANAANGDVRCIQEVNKLLGRITDKSEVSIGLNPEERYKGLFEAERELQREGFNRGGKIQRLAEVSDVSALLPSGEGLHPEQEHGEEG